MYVLLFPFVSDIYLGHISVGHRSKPLALLSLHETSSHGHYG